MCFGFVLNKIKVKKWGFVLNKIEVKKWEKKNGAAPRNRPVTAMLETNSQTIGVVVEVQHIRN